MTRSRARASILAVLALAACLGPRRRPGTPVARGALAPDAATATVAQVARPDAERVEAPPLAAPVPADPLTGEVYTFDDLERFDGARTRQQWLVTRAGVWQLQAWTLLAPGPRASAPEPFRAADAGAPGAAGACPADMVEVRGEMVALADFDLLALQDEACADWRPQEGAADPRCVEPAFRAEHAAACACYDAGYRASHYAACICHRIDPGAYARGLASAHAHTRAMGPFCIDRYEYPNRAGEAPAVSVTWSEAERLCAAAGKRLCTEREWTFACEGPAALPYPTGDALDPAACNVARRLTPYRVPPYAPRDPAYGRALARVWQGLPSGAAAHCVSPFGAFDMAGNVDEWTRSNGPVDEATRRWPSILKGGYWGEELNRCRVSTRSHYPEFSFYQIGFRCCR